MIIKPNNMSRRGFLRNILGVTAAPNEHDRQHGQWEPPGRWVCAVNVIRHFNITRVGIRPGSSGCRRRAEKRTPAESGNR